MKHHTQAPYHLTLKSNGCLILISALSPKHLVVASKHSLGTTTEAQVAAQADARDEELLINGVEKLKVKEDNGKGKAKAEEPSDEHAEARQHAEVGRMWVSRTLDKSGKTEEDLARQLWERNLTAVLEVSGPKQEINVSSNGASCATTLSRSTSSRLRLTGPASIFMDSITTLLTLRHFHQTR